MNSVAPGDVEHERAGSRPHAWRLGHRPALDGLRGVAIVMVVLYHTWPGSLPGGWIGVDLFFVLSGFLITSLLVDEHASSDRVDIRSFYSRRARRLLPALVITLLAVGGVLLAQRAWTDLLTLGFVVGYVANWAGAANQLTGAVEHCWSLAIEEQFYLLWPLVLGLLLGLRSRAAAAMIVGCMILLVLAVRIHGNTPTQTDLHTHLRADALLIGCLLALAFAWFGASRWPWWSLSLTVAPFVATQLVFPRDLRGYGYTLLALGFACVIAAALTCEPLGKLLSAESLRAFGLISYGLYLYHYPILYWLRSDRPHGIYDAGVLDALLGIGLSVAAATASYIFLERRFTNRTHAEAAHASDPVALAGASMS